MQKSSPGGVQTPIHGSHSPEARIPFCVIAAGLLLMLVTSISPATTWTTAISSYVTLHTLLETLSIILALLVFAIIWSTRNKNLPYNLSIIALASLVSGILDFSHLLSFPGMPDYITPNTTNKTILFWLPARLSISLGLLAIAFLPWHKPLDTLRSCLALLLVLALLFALHILFLWYPDILPVFYLEGLGPVPLKRGTEYAITGIFLLAALGFLLHLRRPRSFNASGFLAASLLMALGEVCFNLYMDIHDSYSLIGHLYKITGYFFLFRAIFTDAVKRPYDLLEQSRSRLNLTLSALPDMLFEMSHEGRYLHIYTPERAILESPTPYLLGRTLYDVMPSESADTVQQAIDEAAETGHSRTGPFSLPTAYGKTAWFEISVARLGNRAPKSHTFLVISRNITARYLAEESLRTLSHAVEFNPLAIAVFDRNLRIRQVNHAFTRMTGYEEIEVLDCPPHFLHAPGASSELAGRIYQQIFEGTLWSGEVQSVRKDGTELVVFLRVFPSRSPAGDITRFLSIAEDITDKKNYSALLEQLSQHDQLTGLPNRELLQQHFDQLCADHHQVAVLWLDLDNFKEVNDALGHAVGDILLQQVAYRLRDSLKKNESIGRISGDDFVILLASVSEEQVIRRTLELLELTAQPLSLPEQTLSITASSGIALWPADGDSLGSLLQKAEIGKYKAKASGRNNYQFYESQMQEMASLRLAQNNALKTALDNQELHLCFQPQVCLQDQTVAGVEALLRWNSRDWGVVPPSDFIPLAESSGLILTIGDWVLDTAMAQLRNWLDQGIPPVTMAVNISAIQFEHPDFIEQVSCALARYRIPPQLLELELTEAMAMKKPKISEQRMRELHMMGVKLSIDDFGTGYSSLSYLKRFKIDKLKIDREFIADMDHDPDDQAIVTAIIQMARRLSISVLAEGVETARQAELLRRLGCHQIQGYHYSKPLPASDAASYIRQHSSPA